MRKDLDHPPAIKRRELERVVQSIFDEFDDALGLSKHEQKKLGRIQKVILYGSYARGGWFDEPHTAKGYQSDYYLFITVNDKRLTNRVEYWSRLDERLIRELSVTNTLRTPMNLIVHPFQEVNDGLATRLLLLHGCRRRRDRAVRERRCRAAQAAAETPTAALAMPRKQHEE